MKERQMDCYIKYAKGSLYYAFEQLEKQDAICITTIVRDTNRPDKTIFHITETGKQLFHTLLLKQFEAKTKYINRSIQHSLLLILVMIKS